ncbi:bacteriophage abortive infection AbiH family protein [Thermoanaerobacterium aotearoense]|nr:bacteriophage abortive infection AbiH family protein [Thermoanaerobacterium aotearoense]
MLFEIVCGLVNLIIGLRISYFIGGRLIFHSIKFSYLCLSKMKGMCINMANLFIIGNGFDLAHKIPSSYEDFRRYLLDEYPQAKPPGYIPETTIMPDGGEEFVNEDELVGFLIDIISQAEPYGDKWSDLENSLGFLDLGYYMDDWIENDEDDNEWHEVYRHQDKAESIAKAILKITEFFSQWVGEIKINDKIPINSFKQLINVNNDYFLSFNYTKTLELLYGVKNICHIHGEQGKKIYFGHGNDEDYSEKFQMSYIGSEDALQRMQRYLRKDTTQALKENKEFFEEISQQPIHNIYSFGFSFSQVDTVYIREICNKISTENITWYFNDYDSKEKRKFYEAIVRDCGFKGTFLTYHIF